MNNDTRSLVLVLNEAAAECDDFKSSIKRLTDAGVPIDVFPISQLDKAVSVTAEVLVAAGGDGTVNAVASAILKSDAPEKTIGIVPFGTGNDFATAAGIPTDSPDEALQLILDGRRYLIDVGKLNDRFFVNAISGGFGAEVTSETPDELKSVLGKLAYTITGLSRIFQPEERQTRIRGENLDWEGSLLLLSIANARLAGGGYHVAPDALLDDGLFDVLIVPDAGIISAPAVLVELFDTGAIDNEYVLVARTPWVKVETANGIQLTIDGEAHKENTFHVEMLHRRLSVILPDKAPISAGLDHEHRNRQRQQGND